MRLSIVVWSTVSGTILGLFVDAMILGVALVLSTVVPGGAARVQPRWITIAAVGVLVGIPVVLSVLGYLEGELKAG